MTRHMTGTREEWLAARLELLRRRRNSRGTATSWRGGGRNCRGSGSTRPIDSTPTREAHRSQTCSGALAASRLSLHVRSRLQGGLSILLDDRGWLQRLRRSSGEPRRHAFGGVARAAREAAGVQAADGLDFSLGVLARCRLQLRLQRLVHRGATARGRLRIQLPAPGGVSVAPGRGAGPASGPISRRCAAPTRPPTIATGRA